MRIAILTAGLLAALAASALAGPNVPEVRPEEFPVAGTCAPLPRENVTWVTIGEPDWFRIDGDLRDIDGRELATVIKARGMYAAQAGDPHDVWILTRADREWGQVVNVLAACQEAGIHRVGIEVRSEADGTTYGFPLFLPYGDAVAPGAGPRPRARRLDVRVNIATGEASSPERLYAAAKAAAQQFGPVVAEVSISVRTRVQDAVTAIDMLYRAGCAAVRLKHRLMVRRVAGVSMPELWVEERRLPGEPLDVRLPVPRPRAEPWGDDGAAQAGALNYELEEIPSLEPGAAEREERLKPVPSYAAMRATLDVAALRRVLGDTGATLQQWSAAFGGWLGRILTTERVSVPETLLVKRRRQWQGVQAMFADARGAFADAGAVRPSTVRVQAYLFDGPRVVGRVDATLFLSGPEVELLFAHWVQEESAQDLTLPPRETEPYAAGDPGNLRGWTEAMLALLEREGAAAIPLAPEARVLADLPPVAHRGARAAIARRMPALEALAAWLRQVDYDRVFVTLVSGQAAVLGRDGTVLGVLRYDLEGELGSLSMATLTSRVAPR